MGLRFVVVEQAGEIGPARVAAQLDQAGPQHQAKDQPAQQPDHGARRRAAGEGSRIEQRAQKDREKARLEQLILPAEAEPGLPDVHEGEIQHPEERQQRRVREARQHHEGSRQTEVGGRQQRGVRGAEQEERRLRSERGGLAAEVCDQSLEMERHREQPFRAEQRQHLVDQREEGEEVDETESAQEDEARQPVGRLPSCGPGSQAPGQIAHARDTTPLGRALGCGVRVQCACNVASLAWPR